METIILEFLLGMIIAAVPTFLVITRAALKPSTLPDLRAKEMVGPRTRRPSRTSSVRSKPVKRQRANYRNMKRDGAESSRVRSRENDDSAEASEPASTAVGSLDKCPSCGLEAPQDLLIEHFLGSPGHQHGAVQDDPTKKDATTTALTSEEDDSTNSVRNLLQMLVPPRAFGRRHLQRQSGPLVEIVSR